MKPHVVKLSDFKHDVSKISEITSSNDVFSDGYLMLSVTGDFQTSCFKDNWERKSSNDIFSVKGPTSCYHVFCNENLILKC